MIALAEQYENIIALWTAGLVHQCALSPDFLSVIEDLSSLYIRSLTSESFVSSQKVLLPIHTYGANPIFGRTEQLNCEPELVSTPNSEDEKQVAMLSLMVSYLRSFLNRFRKSNV
jgi:hypothetical protein